MKKFTQSLLLLSLLSSNSLMAYEYLATYDLPKKLQLTNGNIEHQQYLKILDAYILEGGFHFNDDSDNKDGKYELFEQDWQIKDGEQFVVYMKFIKAAERYSSDPYKFILNKKLEIYYDAEFMYMKFDGITKKFDVNPQMIKDFRKINKDIEKISDKLYLQKQFNVGNLYINLNLY